MVNNELGSLFTLQGGPGGSVYQRALICDCIDTEQPGVPSLTNCTLEWTSLAYWARPTPSVPAMESPTNNTLTGLFE